jgi:hypothetical protein
MCLDEANGGPAIPRNDSATSMSLLGGCTNMADYLEASESNRFIAQLCRALFAAEGATLPIFNSHDIIPGSNLGREVEIFRGFPSRN